MDVKIYRKIILRRILVLLIIFSKAFSIPDTEALLTFKQSITNPEELYTWQPDSQPCISGALKNNWDGIQCFDGLVTGLRLGNMGLSGKIDIDMLRELPGLRSISIVNNSFSGTIPEFYRLGSLRAIYLSGNQFSGEISDDYFSPMTSLRKVWLSNNKFTGKIPGSLGQLPNLLELHIENNEFIGEIPNFDRTKLNQIDFSNNKLQGDIPDSLIPFKPDAFIGNPSLCGQNLGLDCNHATKPEDVHVVTPAEHPKNKESEKVLIPVILISLLLFLALIVFGICRRRKSEQFKMLEKNVGMVEAVEVQVTSSASKKDDSSNRNVGSKQEGDVSKRATGSSRKGSNHGKMNSMPEFILVNDEKGVFGLPDLMKAAAEVLGNGGLGSSYKAVLTNGLAVVVKRMRDMNALDKDDFDVHIKRLVRLKHPNLLGPLGYHYRKEEKLLVYEYIPKGSLLYLLHDDRVPSRSELNWPTRLKIIQGIARGISFLHKELGHLDLPHGDIKSSNIFLGSKNDPLISEYGFKPLINPASQPLTMFAFKAPEAQQTGKATQKCDVYCLGVVILEILTGKFPSQYNSNSKGGIDLMEWVPSALSEGRLKEILDPEISGSSESLGEMEKLLHIGLACTETSPEIRIDMKEAIKRILEVDKSHNSPTSIDGYAESARSSFSEQSLEGEISGRRQSLDLYYDIREH